MGGVGQNQQDEPEKLGWYTEHDQGHRSYFSDSPEFGEPEHQPVEDPTRFDQLASTELEPEERQMLIYGLSDWGGPAYGSDALARAMGFADMDRLCTEAQNLVGAIERAEPLSIRDWTRALVATELAFASSVLGTGPDEWFAISGRPSEHWIGILERLQSKLPVDSAALRTIANE